MEQILAGQVAVQTQGQAPRRLGRIASLMVIAPVAAVGVFFLLKAALLAIQGEAAFADTMGAVDPAAGIESLRFWVSGIDPVTETLSRMLTPLVEAARNR